MFNPLSILIRKDIHGRGVVKKGIMYVKFQYIELSMAALIVLPYLFGERFVKDIDVALCVTFIMLSARVMQLLAASSTHTGNVIMRDVDMKQLRMVAFITTGMMLYSIASALNESGEALLPVNIALVALAGFSAYNVLAWSSMIVRPHPDAVVQVKHHNITSKSLRALLVDDSLSYDNL
tara:strand:- start:6846 stop:7382 length:537 start_codon:yes stop_codon:yes gene_type:complete